MKIYEARINHLPVSKSGTDHTGPLGYAMERVTASWKVAEAEGKRQTAARLCVALDAGMQELLYDSGWKEEADSLGTKLPVALAPRTRYYWSVAVRSDAGEEAESGVQWWETGKRDEAWRAKWITCDGAPGSGGRHPLFEQEIRPQKQVTRARLYLCGLGLYEASFVTAAGRKRIGNEYLTPYSNDYNEWVQYQTYDVTNELQESGTLSVLLGNGWYKGRFGFASVEDRGCYGDEWKLIAELVLTYGDGTEEVIGTDEGWTVRRSTICFSNLYDGEHRDDTLPEPLPEQARPCEPPKGTLTERRSTPVTVHEVLAPVALLQTPAGEQVFDLGQEFAGIFRLWVDEPAGTRVRIQTGELLQNGNFYNENLRSAKSEYCYVSGGERTLLEPKFTYYGYRYVKVTGVSNLKKEDFAGLALYSELEETGIFETGHDLLNRLVSNVRWGMKSNFLDVPTDCPQRDERMGWTGDAQVFSPTATFLSDTCAFYMKYLYDIAQEQKTLDGRVPNVVPSAGYTRPEGYTDGTCVWGDAACILPWNLYLFYGDSKILEEQFDSMCAWVDYVRRMDGDDHAWRRRFHFGDWLALDHPAGGAEQVMGGTDEGFIANLYYAASAEIVAKAAHVLGRKREEDAYRELARAQFDAVKREYYSATGRCCLQTQTALLLTLKYGLSENTALIREQLKKLFAIRGNRLATGFVGTPILCGVLSEHGMEDLAYELLFNEEYPGWLHEVKLGATTMWERWNSVLPDGTISGTGMNSLNHYAYGSIVEWMFRHIAGLQPLEETPGFRRVRLAPSVRRELGSLHAEYDSPSGRFVVDWRYADASRVELSVTVPFGAEAEFVPPLSEKEEEQGENSHILADKVNGSCRLSAGEYHFSYRESL